MMQIADSLSKLCVKCTFPELCFLIGLEFLLGVETAF